MALKLHLDSKYLDLQEHQTFYNLKKLFQINFTNSVLFVDIYTYRYVASHACSLVSV